MNFIEDFPSRNTKIEVGNYSGFTEKVLIKTSGLADPLHPANLSLKNEYEILKDIHILGVRKVLALETLETKLNLVLEFIDGITLKQYFTFQNHSLEAFLSIFINLCDVIEQVHQHQIIHKDINPENILIRHSDKQACIIDFGISGKLNLKLENLGSPNKLEGTLAYISPEQTGRMDRVVDYRTDLYSLGVTMYEILTGEIPFNGESPLEIVHAHLAKSPTPPSEFHVFFSAEKIQVPFALSDIISILLSKDAHNRYQSVSGLKHDLFYCLNQLQSEGCIQPFELKSKDFSGRFTIPEKLYGMKNQIAFLTMQFEEVSQGQTILTLIKGPSGVGKTALVKVLQRNLSAKNGMFVAGKFDLLQKNIPHSAFISTFSALIHLKLSENKAELEKWKTKILSALGNLAKVISNIIPDLSKIIGEQPEVPELPTVEAQNRLSFLLREFVKCFCDAKHPLIIFIDDLQWADDASLALLKSIVTDYDILGLLFIGSYRDNEVDATHPLYMTLREIKKEREVRELQLHNLALTTIDELVHDTLNNPKENTLALSKLIFDKTQGNPFFVLQFLKTVHQSGGFKFDKLANSWVWDINFIKNMGVTENVIDLLMKNINQLPTISLDALKLASCIGNRFSIKELSEILDKNLSECLQLLTVAIKDGFVQPSKNQSWSLDYLPEAMLKHMEFAFQHDRIQQAVYEIIPKNEKKELHFSIGKKLIQYYSAEEADSNVFKIVNQLNHGVELITQTDAKIELANLNLKAGLKAKQSAAYKNSLAYLLLGLDLLEKNTWQHYDLSLALYSNAAECAYLSGNHAKMEELVDQVMLNGKSILDKIQVYFILVDAYTARHELPKAIKIGLLALKELGIVFPENPKLIHVFKGLGNTKMKLMGKKTEELVQLPQMSNLKMLQAMPLMEKIAPAAYMAGSQLFPLLVFKMVDVSLKYGNCSVSAFGYASFAITLSGVLGDYDGGLAFANMSMNLLKKYHDDVYKVKVYFVNFCFIRHWKEHAINMVEPLFEAYRSGLEAGNLFSGTWVACYALVWKYYTAYPLDELKSEIESFTFKFRQLKQDGAYNFADILLRTIDCLSNPKFNSQSLANEAINEEELLKRCYHANDKTAVFFLHLNRMQINYLFADYEKAKKCAEEALPLLEAATGLHFIPQFYFYYSLILMADSDHMMNLNKIQSNQKKMKKWAKHAPSNYQHKYDLLEALISDKKGNVALARSYFDEAIQGAVKNGFVQEEGLIYELAFQFYVKTNVSHLSNFMYQSMVKTYQKWGASAKLRHLNVIDVTHPNKNFQTLNPTNFTSTLSSSNVLDMESILKASVILSGETEIHKLIDRFMNTIIENSGADKGLLFLVEKNELILKAEVEVGQTSVALMNLKFDIEKKNIAKKIPTSILNLVYNTKNLVNINHAERNHAFTKDEYLIDNPTKSLICIPLSVQNKLIGILYLENKLLTDVFTLDRLKIINILGSQVAVSLENLKLYEDTLKLNSSLERFVPKEFLSSLNKENIIDVKLGDHVQKEMTILFSDIRNFTAISELMTPEENFTFINEYLSLMEPCIRKNGGFIDKYIGDAIMALFPDSVDKALVAGIEMLNQLSTFNKKRTEHEKLPISIGIGMHTGILMLGTVGGNHRMETTVISDSVNLASRIEQLTKHYNASLLVSDDTFNKLNHSELIHKRKIGEVTIRGKKKPIKVFEIYNADPEELKIHKDASKDDFSAAIDAYEQKKLNEALFKFKKIADSNSSDLVAARFVEFCSSN
jgi:predicted ATPase/class 3 adenylate cyclase